MLFNEFLDRLKASTDENRFVSLTLSKKRDYHSDLEKVLIKRVLIKDDLRFQFVYKYSTKDITKNISESKFHLLVKSILEDNMKIANLFTIDGDHVLQQNKKRRWKLFASKPTYTSLPTFTHDRKKMHLVSPTAPFMVELGIVNVNGVVNKDMGDKFRQIQKFVEIISNLLSEKKSINQFQIVDMGAGKGYLTFALYEYLHNSLNINVDIRGIELRKHLVDTCNSIAEKINYSNLSFEEGNISGSTVVGIDMLIALHACDIATDEAIFKGIVAGANWIVCSPCCQHQIRKDITNESDLKSILKHGILMDRFTDILTDGFRSMILEIYGYTTRVFEFISNEHTGKNLIIVAEKKQNKSLEIQKSLWSDIESIKKKYGVLELHLQKLLNIKL